MFAVDDDYVAEFEATQKSSGTKTALDNFVFEIICELASAIQGRPGVHLKYFDTADKTMCADDQK